VVKQQHAATVVESILNQSGRDRVLENIVLPPVNEKPDAALRPLRL
jgi:hypothetical protein